MKDTAAARGENMVLRALYLLAIVFVVDGHTMLGDLFVMDGLFRYYSFHLLLFAFGAGYFFRLHGGVLRDTLVRARRLLLPLYGWNLFYGVFAALLRRFGGFELGQPLSPYTLLIAPIVDGEHFGWNLGAWYLFALFLAQVIYALIDRASALWRRNDWITCLLCLLVGCASVSLCRAGLRETVPLFVLRALILLPGYALGVLYRRRLERVDNTLRTVPYLAAVVVLRALLCVRYDNLAYLLSSCTYFQCDAFGVYAGGALAIAFWLRVARLLAPYMERSRLALAISRNTLSVMMHHYLGFYALNALFLSIHMLGLGAADFSVRSFRQSAGYGYAPGGRPEWDVLYLLAGLLVPLAVTWAVNKLRALLARLTQRGRGA